MIEEILQRIDYVIGTVPGYTLACWQHCSNLRSPFPESRGYNSNTEHMRRLLKSPERMYRNQNRVHGVFPTDLFTATKLEGGKG